MNHTCTAAAMITLQYCCQVFNKIAEANVSQQWLLVTKFIGVFSCQLRFLLPIHFIFISNDTNV